MQYRRPVGLGPSLKTCPRWEPHFLHKTSVRLIPRVVSSSSFTLSFAAVFQKEGQPVFESYFVSDEKSFDPQTTQTYIPAALLFVNFPENGGSVPRKKQILYCSGVNLFLRFLISMIVLYSILTI